MSARILQLRTLARSRPWFASLLAAYDFMDESLKRELEQAAQKGHKLACKRGCANCCYQPIPISAAEIMGLELAFKSGVMTLPPAKSNGANEQNGQSGAACRFLNPEGFCDIYELRPLACRRYLAYERTCLPGEDASRTRPQDMHRPSPQALLHALRLTLPCYEPKTTQSPAPAAQAAQMPQISQVGRDFFNRHTILLQDVNWENQQS